MLALGISDVDQSGVFSNTLHYWIVWMELSLVPTSQIEGHRFCSTLGPRWDVQLRRYSQIPRDGAPTSHFLHNTFLNLLRHLGIKMGPMNLNTRNGRSGSVRLLLHPPPQWEGNSSLLLPQGDECTQMEDRNWRGN